MTLDTLKGDQPQAFRAIVRAINNKQRIVKLTGSAGTGKTYLVAKIAQYLQDHRHEVTLAAPTHKAKAVIAEKLGDLGAEVATIHSLLGMRLEMDMEEDTGGRILRAASQPSLSGVVICDEASMIGRKLVERIKCVPGVQWIFVGDPAQLPPVGESPSELLRDPDAHLSTIIRQGEGSEIIDLATRIRQGDTSMAGRFGRDVQILRDADALFHQALEAFQSSEYQDDASYARMLVFRNKRRKAINQAMRDLLVGAKDPYVPGEWLVMYSQYSVSQAKLNQLASAAKKASGSKRKQLWSDFWDLKNSGTDEVLHTSQEVLIQEAARATHEAADMEWRAWKLLVTTYGKTYTLYVLDETEKARWQETREDLRTEALALKEERDELRKEGLNSQADNVDKERRSTWGKYFSLENSFAWVDYAYAMTTHKSQGSTFAHTFVDVPDLMRSGGMRQQLLYVACTRPSDTLTYYLNGHEG